MDEPLDLSRSAIIPDAPASIAPGAVTPATSTVVVSPSKVNPVLITLALAIAAVVSGSATLLGFAKAKDAAAFYNWLHGQEAVTYFTALTTVGTIGALGFRSFRSRVRAIYLAYHSRDRIATTSVATPPKPPA